MGTVPAAPARVDKGTEYRVYHFMYHSAGIIAEGSVNELCQASHCQKTQVNAIYTTGW